MLYILIAVVVCALCVRWLADPLRHVPTIGPSFPVLAYIGTLRFVFHAQDMFQEGYDKYPVFKVAMLDRWLVVVSGAKMNEGLVRLRDDQVSFDDAAHEMVQPKYTIAREAYEHPIHVTAIKEWLPRNLGRLFPAILDEVERALDELVPATETEWLSLTAFPTVTQIVARASNRVFVGAPLCRNTEYLEVMRRHTDNVNKAVATLTFCPRFLRPVVARLLPWQRQATNRLRPFLKPLLEERAKLIDEAPERRANDLLTWAMEEAQRIGHPNDEDLLIQAVLAANFAAIHTSSVTFTHALFHLAARPEWLQPLRADVADAVKVDGWTQAALGRMVLLDSFLKEAQRLGGVSSLSLLRYTRQAVALADGTRLPAHTVVTGAMASTHRDAAHFPAAAAFDPLRFARMRAEGEQNRWRYVSTSPVDIGFGHGKHACPGRFFAASELKIMLACVVMRYDVQFQEEGRRPENEWLAYACYPARRAQVLFRRRQTQKG